MAADQDVSPWLRDEATLMRPATHADDLEFGLNLLGVLGLIAPEVRASSIIGTIFRASRPATQLNKAFKFAPWKVGTEVIEEIVPANTKYFMYIDADQAASIMRGNSVALGDWATPAKLTTQLEVRDGLSLLSDFKYGDLYRIEVATVGQQTVNRGIAGPLEGYRGGLEQIQFINGKNIDVVSDPVLLFRK
jgi:hypothetical protein